MSQAFETIQWLSGEKAQALAQALSPASRPAVPGYWRSTVCHCSLGSSQLIPELRRLGEAMSTCRFVVQNQGEMCVSDLEEMLKIRRPTLSQQLSVLRNEAVVSTRREGKNIFYSMADGRLLEMLSVLYRLYCPKE